MSDKARYFEFVQRYPERFTNVPGGIDILLDQQAISDAEQVIAERLTAHGLPAEWAQVGVAFQDQYLLLLRDAVRFPDGALGTYLRMTGMEEDVPGVVILPMFQNEIILEHHYRHGTRSWLWEIPRGMGEKQSSPEENALRELQEEIGATVARLEPLGTVHINSSMIGGYDCLFFAELTALGAIDIAEGISHIQRVAKAEFERMIAENELTDGYTLAAYARAKARGLL